MTPRPPNVICPPEPPGRPGDTTGTAAGHVAPDQSTKAPSFFNLSTFDNREVGDRIRAYRKLAGFSQADLAKQVGLTQPEISRLERQPSQVKIRTLDAVCRVLGITFGDLIEDTPELHRVEKTPASLLKQARAAEVRESDVAENTSGNDEKHGDGGVSSQMWPHGSTKPAGIVEATASEYQDGLQIIGSRDWRVCVIAEDSLRLILKRREADVVQPNPLGPFAVFTSLLATMVASDFRDLLVFKAAHVEAAFWLLTVAAGIWTLRVGIRYFMHRANAPLDELVIQDIDDSA